MTMETNIADISIQNTDHVMKCNLGEWYSDDKTTGFKVLERNEHSTSIRIKFGPIKSVQCDVMPKEFAEDSKTLRDEIANEKENIITTANDLYKDEVMSKHINSQYEEEKMNIDSYTNKINKNSNGIVEAEISRKYGDELQNESKLDANKEHTKYKSSLAQDIEVNEEVPVNPAEPKSQMESGNAEEKLEDSNIAYFVSNHALFFVALSIANFALAVLITLFCFVFPGAYGTIKSTIVKARDWTASKIEAGITYSQEIPNFGMNMAQKSATVLSLPFNWIWRFLNCIGKCFGLKMPEFSFSFASVHMPRLRASMPKWLSCLFNCFKGEDVMTKKQQKPKSVAMKLPKSRK